MQDVIFRRTKKKKKNGSNLLKNSTGVPNCIIMFSVLGWNSQNLFLRWNLKVSSYLYSMASANGTARFKKMWAIVWIPTINIESLQNILLKDCYVPATRASSSEAKLLLLFFFFFGVAINSTNEANKEGSTCH